MPPSFICCIKWRSWKVSKKSGIDFNRVLEICEEIRDSLSDDIELAIVVGGGNFWRGRSNKYMDKCTSDHIGMLATTMNALAINDAFLQLGVQSLSERIMRLFSSGAAEFIFSTTSIFFNK